MNEARSQQPHPDYPPYEDDEINLLDYVIVLLKYKWLILGIVIGTGVATVIFSLMLPNIYRSEATIIPRQQEKSATSSALSALGALSGMAGELVGLGGGGDVDKFEVVLKSRYLARRVVEKYKLMPELFEDEWDPLKKQWKENPAPTIQDACKLITKKMLTVVRDRNVKQKYLPSSSTTKTLILQKSWLTTISLNSVNHSARKRSKMPLKTGVSSRRR